MQRVFRYILIALVLYASWLALMGIHECGHVLHAWLSGGHVLSVHFGLFEFSRTEMSIDPHPQFVAWGGPIWGCLIPLLLYAVAVAMRLRFRRWLGIFAGLCLIVNGGYIGIGWIDQAGDAGTLLRHGASAWVMATTGLMAMAAGLLLWHLLGASLGRPSSRLSQAVFLKGERISSVGEESIKVLQEVIELLQRPETEVMYSQYNSAEEAITDLDDHLSRLLEGDISKIQELKLLFAPTGSLQDISIDSGWGDRF
jgi:hypothetical protein